MERYVAEHQDRSRNALNKSLEAAFVSWQEDLRADEALYLNDKILSQDLSLARFLFTVCDLRN